MPNIDFERRLIPGQLAQVMDAPDFERKLLSVKARLDYEDADIVRVNFLDTFRPELWCIEGLSRYLAPIPGRHYDLTVIENLPEVPTQFLNVPQGTTAWALYVQVDPHLAVVDDGYFLKKVRDQIGFGSHQNLDVSIAAEMEHIIAITIAADDESETQPSLTLVPGMNTVVITALDQRIGAWLLCTFVCNYLDRGYSLLGFASSTNEEELFAKWQPFVLGNAQVVNTFGFSPTFERFRSVLQRQHYLTHYDEQAQTWYISPPIFRLDIIHPVDILEDYLVATGYDFDEIMPRSLASAPATGSQTKRSVLEERLVNYMQAYGARQTVGLLLDSYENLVERMCHDAPERLIHLNNAVNKNREYAIDSSLPPLLRNAVHPTAPLPPTCFYLFTETLALDEKKVAHSRWKMGILFVGTDHPFNNAHTLLDALCYHLRLGQFSQLKRSNHRSLIPGRQMTVSVGETPIGQFGEVHPEVLTRWELFYPTSFIELDLDAISEMWDGNQG